MTAVSDRWLTLKISDPIKRPQTTQNTTVFFSIPKKVVRLSTARNRLRRLMREALRVGEVKLRTGKVYSFRVQRMPKEANLARTLAVMKELLNPKA